MGSCQFEKPVRQKTGSTVSSALLIAIALHVSAFPLASAQLLNSGGMSASPVVPVSPSSRATQSTQIPSGAQHTLFQVTVPDKHTIKLFGQIRVSDDPPAQANHLDFNNTEERIRLPSNHEPEFIWGTNMSVDGRPGVFLVRRRHPENSRWALGEKPSDMVLEEISPADPRLRLLPRSTCGGCQKSDQPSPWY